MGKTRKQKNNTNNSGECNSNIYNEKLAKTFLCRAPVSDLIDMELISTNWSEDSFNDSVLESGYT